MEQDDEQRRAELIGLALRHAPGDGLHATPIGPLQLIRASAPSLRLPAVYEPGLCVVLQGRKQALVGTEVVRYDPLHCLVISVTVPTIGQILEATPERPYLCVPLNLDVRELAELMLQVMDRPAGQALPSQRGLQACLVEPGLLDAVLRLLRLIDTPHDHPILLPLALREIHYRVLCGPLGPALRRIASEGSQSHRVAPAIELLQRRFDEPLRIEALAQAVHMSTSSLHHHFKQVTAMSPLQFQKQLRLHQARRLMLVDGLDAAAAAHRVGYESASQFSREYRRLFGAPPRSEVEQLKVAVRGPRRPILQTASA